MILGIDVDGPLRNFVGDLRRIYDSEFPEKPSLEVKAWDMLPYFPAFKTQEELKNFWSKEHCSQIFGQGDLVDPEAPKIIQDLRRDGHIVIIVTHQLDNTARIYTLQWLAGRGVKYDAIFFGKDKTLAHINVLLDDGSHNLVAAAKKNQRGVAYDTPYNQDWNFLRVHNWQEFKTLVGEIR